METFLLGEVRNNGKLVQIILKTNGDIKATGDNKNTIII